MARTEGAFKQALEKIKGQEPAVLEAGNLAQITTLKEQSQQLRSFGTGVYQQTLQLLFLAQNFNPFTETPEPFYTEKTNPLLAERDLNKFLGNVIQQVALAEQAGIPRETIEQEAGIRIRALPLPEDVQLPQYGHLVVIELIDKSSPEEYQLTLARFGGTIPPTPIGISDKGEEVYDQREISIGMNFGLQLDSPVHNWLTQTRTFNPALLSETSELDFPMPMLEEAKRYATDFIGKDVWHYTEITDLTPVEDIPDIEALNKQIETKAAAAERFINAIDLDAIYLAREEKAEAQRIKDEEIAEKQRIKDVERAAKLARLKETVDRVNGGNKQRLTELATVLGLGDGALVIQASVNLQQEKGRHVVKSVRSIQGRLNASLEPAEAVTYKRQGTDVSIIINGKTVEFSASGIKGLSPEDQNALLIIFIQYAGLPSGKQNEKANAKTIREFLAEVAKIRFPQEPKPERRLTASINGHANGIAPIETAPVQPPIGPNETNGNNGANSSLQKTTSADVSTRRDIEDLPPAKVTMHIGIVRAASGESPIFNRAEREKEHIQSKADEQLILIGKIDNDALLTVLERKRAAMHLYADIAEAIAEEEAKRILTAFHNQKPKRQRYINNLPASIYPLVRVLLEGELPEVQWDYQIGKGKIPERIEDEAARTWLVRYFLADPEEMGGQLIEAVKELEQTETTRRFLKIIEQAPLELQRLYEEESIEIQVDGTVTTLTSKEADIILESIIFSDANLLRAMLASYLINNYSRSRFTPGSGFTIEDANAFARSLTAEEISKILTAGFGLPDKAAVKNAIKTTMFQVNNGEQPSKESRTTIESTQAIDSPLLKRDVTIEIVAKGIPANESPVDTILQNNSDFRTEKIAMGRWLNESTNKFQTQRNIFRIKAASLTALAKIAMVYAQEKSEGIIEQAEALGIQEGKSTTVSIEIDKNYAQLMASYIERRLKPKMAAHLQPAEFATLRAQTAVKLALGETLSPKLLLEVIIEDLVFYILEGREERGGNPVRDDELMRYQKRITSLSENELWNIICTPTGQGRNKQAKINEVRRILQIENY